MTVGARVGRWSWCVLVALAACSSPSSLGDAGTGAAGRDGGAAGASDAAAGAGGGAAGTGAAGTGNVDAAPSDGDAPDASSTDVGDADPAPPDALPPKEPVHWGTSRDLDLLFMIDDSFSMRPLQQKLVAQFPSFIQVLEGLPGGLPSLHLAVVSSDLGAGAYSESDIPNCRHGGDQGVFQSAPRGTTCAQGMLNAGQTFISNVGGQANYTGDLSDVFSCIAAIGDMGCGFEHQLASVSRALGADGFPAPAANANFLRSSANLAVVLVTNEDDCSAPFNSMVFDPASRFVSDTLGPLASFRCNEFGHLCGGARPPRTPAGGAQDLSGTCHSAEDGVLTRISTFVAQLKALKADPSQVIVSAIAGPATPYVVSQTTPTLKDDPSMWPMINHSCTQADGTNGDPAIRISDWVSAFGSKGSFLSICNESFEPALKTIAASVGSSLDLPCLDSRVLDTSLGPNGLQPDCVFVDHVTDAGGMRVDTPLSSCAQTGNVAPCWTIAADARCGSGQLVTFKRAAGASADVTTTATCQVCSANDARPGCGP